MNKFLTFFLILGFGALAVFGFLGMNHGNSGCIAALASGIDCLSLNHLDIFKGFSTATLVSFAVLSLFVALVFFAARPIPPPPFVWLRLTAVENFASFAKRQFIRWLSLHENSPSFS